MPSPSLPTSCGVSPGDLLGIDPTTTLTDRLGRLLPVAGDGVVRHELLV